MKFMRTCTALLVTLATSTAFADNPNNPNPPPFGNGSSTNTCLNVSSNSVVSFGNIGAYINGDVSGHNNKLNLGDQLTCAPVQKTSQLNSAMQKAYAKGVPVTFGLGNYTGIDADNDAGLGNGAGQKIICAVDDISKSIINTNVLNNQFVAQACNGEISKLVNLPVLLDIDTLAPIGIPGW